MSPFAQQALDAAKGYLRSHPEELGRALRSAIGLRASVPFVALRWVASQAEKSGKVKDLTLDPVPPGVRIAATIEPMQTPIRASATLYVDRIVFDESQMTIALRVENIELRVIGDARTPIAAVIKSGALNLANVGTLLGYLPNRPAIIADAQENRVTLDLMRDPKIGMNPMARKAVGLATGFVTLKAVASDDDHLDLAFRALPTGVRGAVDAVRHHAVFPPVGNLLKSGGKRRR
jgi:hypothetical protein